MNLYFVNIYNGVPLELSDELEYTMPALPASLSLKKTSLFLDAPEPGDLLLLYTTVKSRDGGLSQVIVAYFQTKKIKGDEILPQEVLTFDRTRVGAGVLKFSKKRTLTRYSSRENHWSLPELFRCVRLSCGKRELSPRFREEGGVRYFESTTPFVKITPPVSRASGAYFDAALCEWASSVCEDVRGEATRRFDALKKGETGLGKTGFIKYSYIPDSRSRFYCRRAHTVGKRNMALCEGCPMYKKEKGRKICSWSLPLYGASPYIPLTTADAFAYFDVLLEKGLVMDYRD